MILESKDYFYLNGGGVLRNVEELLDALKKISDDVLNYHVTIEKNDFSNWLLYVLNEKALSKKLLTLKTRTEMIKAVEKRVLAIEKIKTKHRIIGQIKESHDE